LLPKFPDNPRMSTASRSPWALYLLTFFAALLAAASAAYWVLGLVDLADQTQPRASVLQSPAAIGTKDLARALGGDLAQQAQGPEGPSASLTTQYQLLGVVAGPVGKGYALLLVDGAPPKAYSVGAVLADGLVLQSVSARGAKIGSSLQGGTSMELSLPKPAGS
jgi:general secretion pathway protein C